MLALELLAVFWSWSRENLSCDQPFKRHSWFLPRSAGSLNTHYVLCFIGMGDTGIVFLGRVSGSVFMVFITLLHELVSPLLASLRVLLELFPACCRDGLMNNPSQDINFYDVNVCGGCCDIIILDSACSCRCCRRGWVLHGAGQWAGGGKGPWLLLLPVLAVLFQHKTDFISQSLFLLAAE